MMLNYFDWTERVSKVSFQRKHSFQNGYPSRRRSLVDDARFETLVVKQTKQSVLEEARARANGKLDIILRLHDNRNLFLVTGQFFFASIYLFFNSFSFIY